MIEPMQPIAAFVLALLVLTLAFALLLSLRRRDLPFWAWAWVANLGAGIGFGVFGDVPTAVRFAHLLAALFPALMLAGSFTFVNAAVPQWLLPLTAVAAVSRASVPSGHLIIAPLEIGAYLAAALVLARSQQVMTSLALARLLSVGMVALAGVEVADFVMELGGS